MKQRVRSWLGIQEEPDPQMQSEEDKPDAENAKAIAELAYQRYSDDLSQRRDIESRAMPLLSLLSAAIVFVIGSLSNAGTCLTRNEHLTFYAFSIIGMVFMFLGLFNLLLVLTT